MSKPKKKVYIYTEDGSEELMDSIASAAYALRADKLTVSNFAREERVHPKKQFLAAFRKLSKAEVQTRYDEFNAKLEALKKTQKETKERSNSECKEIINQQEFSVNCSDRQVTYVPRNRKERIKLLKNLIWASNYNRWYQIPQKIAVLEKRAFEELLDSLL